MPITIKETQKCVTKENPGILFDYAIERIVIDDSRNKLFLYMRGVHAFNGLVLAIKELHILAEKESSFTVPFKTIMYMKQNVLTLENDMKFALAYMLDRKAISKKTYDLVLHYLKQPEHVSRPTFSTMDLYD
jgi:hypothetical protein